MPTSPVPTTSPIPSSSSEGQPVPDLSPCPPVFVLSTHLSLPELHDVEERLLSRGARLTYDIAEAGLVLGKVGQKKRAALELRARGVWTEGADEHDDDDDEMVDSSGGDDVKVVRLAWLDQCLEKGAILPIHPFLVYQARKTARATNPQPATATAGTNQILQRARQDAASQPAPSAPRRRAPGSPTSPASQPRPPKLYRQTTSEHDESVALPPAPDWVRDNVMYACMRSAPLHPPNEAFIEQLAKIRKVRELTLDEVGVRAYSTSIAAIAAYPYEFSRPAEVQSLSGCDAKIATLFAEFQARNGTLSAANALDADPELKVLAEFNRIWGVGAKTARDFYHRQHWRDLDDLVEYGWSSLSRVQQIGVKFFDEFSAGISRAETEAIAGSVRRHANLVRPDTIDGHGVECVIVGGYRRGKETSNDVDIVLSHRDERVTRDLIVDVVASLEGEGLITHTLALHVTSSAREQATLPFHADDGRHFDTLDKALVVWQDPHTSTKDGEAIDRRRNTNPHRRVDIIISPWRTVGCAVLGWSGDTTFERDLRRFAKKRHGWKFDSSGVRERTSGGRVVDLERGGQTWQERERLVLEGIGVGWRDAAERCTR
ncbi:hypothetical protein PHISP_06343 [Aspergillus sp. HF37]|nr:hypothetical protein PHISP_06343 [Aspergillus sp. HF37]